jgi:hypothetical protein
MSVNSPPPVDKANVKVLMSVNSPPPVDKANVKVYIFTFQQK